MKILIMVIFLVSFSFGGGYLLKSNQVASITGPICFSDSPTEIWCEFDGLSLIYSNTDLKELTIGLTIGANKTLSVADLDNDDEFDTVTYNLSGTDLNETITDTNLDGTFDYIFSVDGNDRFSNDGDWLEVKETNSSKTVIIDNEIRTISFKEHPYRYSLIENK